MVNSENTYLPEVCSSLLDGPWLILAPHPDDEAFGMGGSLLLAKKAKFDVDVLFLTDGALGGEVAGDLVAVREQEARQAAKKLGVRKCFFWREPDRGLVVSEGIVNRLVELINDLKPATVFFPSPQEPHPDHRVTSVLAWESLRKTNFFATPVSYDISVQGLSNHLVDISRVIDQKCEVMRCYTSQLSENKYIERILGLNQSRAWSLPLIVSHAESFYQWPKEDRPINALLMSKLALQCSAPALPSQSPLVSVVTRTQDRPEFLREAIRSVVSQTYANIELIVVNDGGKCCQDLVKEEATGHIRQFCYQHLEQQSGRSHAANVGLELTQGELIIFLDDDDWFLPEHINSLVKSLIENANAIAAYNNVACVKKENNKWTTLFEFNNEFDAGRLTFENYLPIHAVLFRRAILESGCRFVEHLSMYEDWAFWVKASQLGPFVHNNELGAMYRIDTNSGVGLPGTNQSFDKEYRDFIEWAKNEWSFSQAFTLVRNSVQRTEFEEKFHQSNKKIDQLQLQLTHAKRGFEIERNHILSSTSWRITAPLRFLKVCVLRLRRQFFTVCHLIRLGKYSEILRIIQQRILGHRGDSLAVSAIDWGNITILTTQHGLFVAHLLEKELSFFAQRTEVITQEPANGFGSNLYFVICPQMFTVLPQNYIAFQMEQSVNPRWFNKQYFSILKKAQSVLDYSLKNIAFLHEKHIEFQDLFYVPVSYFPAYPRYLEQKGFHLAEDLKKYEVVFYGDIHNPRRQRFLEKITKRFNTLIVTDSFAEHLYSQLLSARVVVNIHYYENALLETTRIYECLSLGLSVVSEISSDSNEHSELNELVSFTPLDDVEAMVDAIDNVLQRQQNGYSVPDVLDGSERGVTRFGYFFNRFLLASEFISYEQFYDRTKNFSGSIKQEGTCLSLPESIDRQRYFAEHDRYGFQVFSGLRFQPGWVGCGLSYKDIIHRARDAGLEYIIVCEDDVEFGVDYENQLLKIEQYLQQTTRSWHVFSGLISHLHPETEIKCIDEFQGVEFIHINKMVSMVFNIYHRSIFDRVLLWDETDKNAETNTIDRFLEGFPDLDVITTVPFLVGHHEACASTLWGFSNATYNEMIHNSQESLKNKVLQHKGLMR